MDDLVAFVEERLTEDELWAKAASTPRWPDDNPLPPGGVHWTWGVGNNWDPVDPDPLEPYIGGYDGQWSQPVTLRSVEEWTGSVGPLPLKIAESEELRTADGAHIVRHDPARVLREVKAKRLILTDHRRVQDGFTWTGQVTDPASVRVPVWICNRCSTLYPDAAIDESSHVSIGWPCLTVRALAAPYADHPDFRPEWGVDHG